MYVCFEGIDGCGKSTQISLLNEHFERLGYKTVIAKHPGFTPFGSELRNLILHGSQPECDLAHRLLFWADAVETAKYWNEVKDDDIILIMDRRVELSNWAYGYALYKTGKTDHKYVNLHAKLSELLKIEPGGLGFTFILDVPVDIAFQRIKQRGKELTIIEQRGKRYFEIVRSAYRAAHLQLLPRSVWLDGTKPIDQIHNEILEWFEHAVTWEGEEQ